MIIIGFHHHQVTVIITTDIQTTESQFGGYTMYTLYKSLKYFLLTADDVTVLQKTITTFDMTIMKVCLKVWEL